MKETKRCPYCGEEIMKAARKCKHCGEWLDKEQLDERKASPTLDATPKFDVKEECKKAVSKINFRKIFNKTVLIITGIVIILAVGGVWLYSFLTAPKVIEGWELGYIKDANGNEDKAQPIVSKTFQSDKGEITITFTKDGFILQGANLPAGGKTLTAQHFKLVEAVSSNLSNYVDGGYIATYDKAREALIIQLEWAKDWPSDINIFNGNHDGIRLNINLKGGEGVRKAIEAHISNSPEIQNLVANSPALENWEDSLAYALGVRYITAGPVEGWGYDEDGLYNTKPLKEYLEGAYETHMGSGFNRITYDGQYDKMAERGVLETIYSNPSLSSELSRLLIAAAKSDWYILDMEGKMSPNNPRINVIMNREYRTLDSLLRVNPDFSYTTHYVKNYNQKKDSILNLPSEAFVMPSNK